MGDVMDRFRLDGRVALVTGGTKGLGRAIAEALASAGADIVVSARDGEAASRVAGEIGRTTGGRRWGCPADVPSAAQVDGMMARTIATMGRLDILVNNAGINIRGPIEQLDEGDWDAVIDTNLKGPWLCCRAVAATMKAQKWGRVINVSSMLGEISMPGRSPYASSKGGLTLLTKTLALEWARDGINVNALCPGPFATEINTPLLNDPAARAQMEANVPLAPLGRPGRAGAGGGLPRLGSLQLHDGGDPLHRRGIHGPLIRELDAIDGGESWVGATHRVEAVGLGGLHRPYLEGRTSMLDGHFFRVASEPPASRPASSPRAGDDLAIFARRRALRGGRHLHDQPDLRRAGEVVSGAAPRGGYPRRRGQRGERQRGDR